MSDETNFPAGRVTLTGEEMERTKDATPGEAWNREDSRVARQLREASEDIMRRVSIEAVRDHFNPKPGQPRRNISPMFVGEEAPALTWVPLEHAGEEVFYEPGSVIEVRQSKTMGRILLTWECLFRPVTPPAYAHRLEAVLNPKAPTDDRLDVSFNPFFERGVSFLTLERVARQQAKESIWGHGPIDIESEESN